MMFKDILYIKSEKDFVLCIDILSKIYFEYLNI